jgi:hypothetical protein
MKRIVGVVVFALFVAGLGLMLVNAQTGAQYEAGGAAPRLSTFAPAEDLTYELDFLVGDLEKAVSDKDEFDSQIENRFVRDGNTIALLATALALHDQDNAVKPHAQAIMAAAQKLTEAKDYAAIKTAVENLKGSLGASAGGDVKWRKISAFKSLMNDEVSSINNKLKTAVDRVKKQSKDAPKRAKEATANAAMMALIAENAKLYLAETKKPGESQKWIAFSVQFRTAATDVAAKVRAGNRDALAPAMERLNQTCNDCHAVFNPEKANPKD